MDLNDQKTTPLTPKSFIYNRYPFSQAGRRGFEPRLPLQNPATYKHLYPTAVLQNAPFQFTRAFSTILTAANPLIQSRSRVHVLVDIHRVAHLLGPYVGNNALLLRDAGENPYWTPPGLPVPRSPNLVDFLTVS